jgi:GntR family transcriptional regulator
MDIAQECGLLTPHDVAGGSIRAMAGKGHIEIGYSDERPLRLTLTIFAGDRNRLVYELGDITRLQRATAKPPPCRTTSTPRRRAS